MLQALGLYLPALLPSWRFFSAIAPSPRVEFALSDDAQEEPAIWQEFRPRPARLSFGAMLVRLVWNRHWNESLFMVTCAERVLAHPGEHSIREIATRIAAGLPATGRHDGYLTFRLVFVYRDGSLQSKSVEYVSQPKKLSELAL